MPRNFNFVHPISASEHFNRAVECLHKAFHIPQASYIFYAALEFRISIERLLIEYLALVGTDEDKVSKMINEYRIKNLARSIYETEPEFDKKIEFLNFYLTAVGIDSGIKTLDKDKLNYYYGKLGNYLHSFKKPYETTQNQDWWDNLIQFIEETRSYLFEFLNVPRGYSKLNEKGMKLFVDYKNDSIPREEIKRRILSGE